MKEVVAFSTDASYTQTNNMEQGDVTDEGYGVANYVAISWKY